MSASFKKKEIKTLNLDLDFLSRFSIQSIEIKS